MFASALGFDMSIVWRLTQSERDGIEWLAASYLLSAGLVCAPFGYVAWLSTQSVLVAVSLAAAGCSLLLAILRLSIAGSGTAADSGGVTNRSYSGPVLILTVVSVLGAQPAQMLLRRSEASTLVAARRQALLAQHAASLPARSDAAASGQAERRKVSYRAQLARCEFVGLRLQQLWAAPARAIRDTLLYVGLVLLFGVLARVAAGSALGSYERRCARLTQALIARDAAATRRTIHALLLQYPTYAPDDTGARAPLRAAWPKAAP